MSINKLKIINDPVHGFIKIPHEILFDVVEHRFFQRLRRISQTGLLSLVFPGATHTRFHHALGAMHLMFTALETLKLKGVKISKEEEKSAMLAILLHDVGHGPFSHALENLLMEDWHHEKISILLMNKINEEFDGELSMALEMFQGKYHRKFFNQLISSQLDVDRLDYLKRDSFFTGVSEGSVNTQRIISMMNVCDDELVIDEKGVYSIENFLTARMFMYWQVYYHKTSALAEHLLVKILSRAKQLISEGKSIEAYGNLKYFLYKTDFEKATEEDINRFTQLDDTDVLSAIKTWQNADDFVLSYFCRAVVQRKFPKTVFSSHPFEQDLIDEKKKKANHFFEIDNGELLVEQISRTLLPYDTEKQPIFLLNKSGEKIKLEDAETQILSAHINQPTTKNILYFPREILNGAFDVKKILNFVNYFNKFLSLQDMEFTAAQIASFINGKIIGDESASISGVSPIENAQEGQLSFVSQEKFADYIFSSEASVIIVSEKFVKEGDYKSTLILVEDAYLSFQVLMNLYQQMREEKKSGIEQFSTVSESAILGEDVYIGAHTYISDKVKIGNSTQIYPQVYIGKNVKIGENCIIYSGARIYDYCIVGDNCIVHSNTVIGSDGFGFQPTENGYQKIPQLGNVVLENNVEIGSNCSIDRGTIGSTVIGEGTKIDNLIQIAHNVRIGKNNVIAAQAGIAGSTIIGDWNQIGGQTGIVGHIKIGNQVRIQAQSGVNSNVEDKETLYGSPAISAGDYRRNYVHFRNLTEIVKRISELEKNQKRVVMTDKQKTLGGEITLSGIGLHTGREVHLTMKPAKENTGFVFVRTDLEGKPQVEADVNYVTTTERGTTLEKLGVKIHTCEHLLAALVGMDVDNAILELDSAEAPIMDGSSKYFVEAIEKVGVEEQEQPREYLVIKEVLNYQDPHTGSEITIIPSENYEITTMVDFGTKILGTQNASLKNISDFKEEISSARTFSFLHELEMLLDNGLIKGGDISNAIVYVDKELTPDTAEKLKKAFGKDEVTMRPNGILDNLTLNYPNEAARHKLLDVIGDLALTGVKIKGKVIATKPGHFVNTQFAKKLNRQWKLQKKKNVPDFDLKAEPVYDINGIMKLLPHRPPFLLIDKILEISDSHVVGLKNITMNEPFFVGHFPKEPVMPGVLQIEAMAQAGGILVLANVPDPENYSTYFVKMDKVKFKKKVIPGDTLIFKIELIEPIRRGIVHMQGYGYVGDSVVVEAELMAQVAKKNRSMIHQLAAVDRRAKIGKDVTIEPFTTIAGDVEIGDGTWIGPNVTIMDGARIGKNCRVFPGTVISAIPQDLKFDGEDTQTIIGDRTTIRECVTINRGTKALGYTKIGNDCLIMATSHIAHDCVLGNNVIIVNGCGIAGHVEIGDFTVMGGLSAVHQFGKIGKHVMISGGTLVRKDIPPYVKVAREPMSYAGINSVGLRRRGFSNERIFEIQKVYRAVFQMKLNVSQAITFIEKELPPTEDRDEIVEFIKNSPRGIVKGYGSGKE